MNPEYMCIEEAPEPLPFHGQFETDFWESVSQENRSSSRTNFDSEHFEMSSVFNDGEKTPFTEGVSN